MSWSLKKEGRCWKDGIERKVRKQESNTATSTDVKRTLSNDDDGDSLSEEQRFNGRKQQGGLKK